MSRSRGSSGRPLKGGQRRRVVATKVPPQLHVLLIDEAERRGVPLCDLGALLLLAGWNAERAESGLSALPVPDYLQAAESARALHPELQEPLLAS